MTIDTTQPQCCYRIVHEQWATMRLEDDSQRWDIRVCGSKGDAFAAKAGRRNVTVCRVRIEVLEVAE